MKKFSIMFLLAATYACKPASEKFPITKKVAVSSGVAVRKDASTKSAIVTNLPYGTDVTATLENLQAETLLGLTGKWFKVTTSKGDGWVFSPLLKNIDEAHVLLVSNGLTRKITTIDNSDLISAVSASSIKLTMKEKSTGTGEGCQGTFELLPNGMADYSNKFIFEDTKDIVCSYMPTYSEIYKLRRWETVGKMIVLIFDTARIDECHVEKCMGLPKDEMSSNRRDERLIVKVTRTIEPGHFEVEFHY